MGGCLLHPLLCRPPGESKPRRNPEAAKERVEALDRERLAARRFKFIRGSVGRGSCPGYLSCGETRSNNDGKPVLHKSDRQIMKPMFA